MLRAIGVTVTLGVVSNFVLALLLTRESEALATGYRATGQNGNSLTSSLQPLTERKSRRTASSPLSSLIPHQGSMCLLERVIEWSDATDHPGNGHASLARKPVTLEWRLQAVHLCEYGAQAMAVHGALRAQAQGQGSQRRGCWCRCAQCHSTASASMTCPAAYGWKPRAFSPAPPASNMLFASFTRKHCWPRDVQQSSCSRQTRYEVDG